VVPVVSDSTVVFIIDFSDFFIPGLYWINLFSMDVTIAVRPFVLLDSISRPTSTCNFILDEFHGAPMSWIQAGDEDYVDYYNGMTNPCKQVTKYDSRKSSCRRVYGCEGEVINPPEAVRLEQTFSEVNYSTSWGVEWHYGDDHGYSFTFLDEDPLYPEWAMILYSDDEDDDMPVIERTDRLASELEPDSWNPDDVNQDSRGDSDEEEDDRMMTDDPRERGPFGPGSGA